MLSEVIYCTFVARIGINGGPLPGRSGAIQAVVNIEVFSANLDHVNIIKGPSLLSLVDLATMNIINFIQ